MSDGSGEGEMPETVEADEARRMVAGGNALVFDIRDAEEFADERINGSVHCDPNEIGERLGEDHRERVLVVCADGERSAEVAESLRGDGIEAASLEGGFAAWTSDHLPTAPNPDEEYEGPPVKLPGAVASAGEPETDEDDEDGDAGDEGEDAEGGEDAPGDSGSEQGDER